MATHTPEISAVEQVAPATHTPGPWRLDEPDDHEAVVSDDYHCIDAGRGYHDRSIDNGFGLSGFMSLADARLISAAPDLLEALKYVAEQILAQHVLNDFEEEGLKKARAAIRKAEGR